MLDFIPLPIIWLLFYLLGRLADAHSVVFRRGIFTLVSSFLLLGAVGFKTWGFYTGLGVVIALVGAGITRHPASRLRSALFWCSISATILLVVVYLKFRPFFPKYFPALPSLSYLGFRAIAYLVSCRAGRPVGLSAGLMQMLFFPVLFLGPITRVEDYDVPQRDYRNVLERLIVGCGMLIAAHFLSPLVFVRPELCLDQHWSRFWLSAIANSFEFYFSFAGYSHLIIALGLLAGFRIAENFNNPYAATSIREFWRRWHMSLSYWIRDYVYIPLGGNRKGLPRKCVNMIVAMGLCGLWHGLEPHYLAWGLFHGALLAGESVLDAYGKHLVRRLFPRAYVPVKVLTTFALVTFSWLLFKYSISQTVIHLRAMMPW